MITREFFNWLVSFAISALIVVLIVIGFEPWIVWILLAVVIRWVVFK